MGEVSFYREQYSTQAAKPVKRKGVLVTKSEQRGTAPGSPLDMFDIADNHRPAPHGPVRIDPVPPVLPYCSSVLKRHPG